MDNSKRVFNSRLRELRESRNLSQEKVAKRIDVSVKEYSKWEENIFNMPMDKICELAKFYRVNSPYIYRFTNDDSEIDTYDFYFDIVCERIGSIVINECNR